MVTDVAIKHILNMLAIQTRRETISEQAIDNQFLSLMRTVERYFREHEYDLLFEWLNELIKKEVELKQKQEEDFRTFRKDSINLLICKVNLFHSRIVEMLVDEIDLSYQDFLEMKSSNPEFATQIKFSTIAMANEFINHLTENRSINELVIDQYICLISQSLQIFNL